VAVSSFFCISHKWDNHLVPIWRAGPSGDSVLPIVLPPTSAGSYFTSVVPLLFWQRVPVWVPLPESCQGFPIFLMVHSHPVPNCLFSNSHRDATGRFRSYERMFRSNLSQYFNIRNTLPKSGTFLLGHPVYVSRVNVNCSLRSHAVYVIMLTRDACLWNAANNRAGHRVMSCSSNPLRRCYLHFVLGYNYVMTCVS
jgi:hypothetical protein